MTTEISSLLKYGWENLWKNRILWLFSALVLIEPLIRLFIPIQRPISLLSLLISWASIYFTFMSLTGVSFIAYNVAIRNPINVTTAFQASKKLLWRIIALTLLQLLFVVIVVLVVGSVFWNFLQIKNFRHDIIFASTPLYIFTAVWCFSIIEMIANDTKVGISLKTSWTVFTRNFVNLAIIGLLLILGLHFLDISISIVAMLFQNNFDVTVLNNLDFIEPQYLLSNKTFYKLITAIPQMIWQAYSTSIFTFAYLKYSGVKIDNDNTS